MFYCIFYKGLAAFLFMDFVPVDLPLETADQDLNKLTLLLVL